MGRGVYRRGPRGSTNVSVEPKDHQSIGIGASPQRKRNTPGTGAVTGGPALLCVWFNKKLFFFFIRLIFGGFFVSTLARKSCSVKEHFLSLARQLKKTQKKTVFFAQKTGDRCGRYHTLASPSGGHKDHRAIPAHFPELRPRRPQPLAGPRHRQKSGGAHGHQAPSTPPPPPTKKKAHSVPVNGRNHHANCSSSRVQRDMP